MASGSNSYGVHIEDLDEDSSSTDVGSGESGPTNLIESGFDSICVETAINEGQNPRDYCALDADGHQPQLTPAMIATAFRDIPLPASDLLIQPANHRTLVNFATNFYTDAAPFLREVRLLGHTIALQITPASYTWHYGDGASATTTTPGAAYPALALTHTYLRKGTVTPSLDTTYIATYRVDDRGPWREVDGTVTIAGPGQPLEVVTATPALVGTQ